MTTFLLGTHQPGWLEWNDRVPLFVSDRRLRDRTRLPIAAGPWALDSGGFTELSTYGAWQTTPAEYATRVRRYQRRIGHLQWAAIQDWMVEPFVLAKTGLPVNVHQWRTIDSWYELHDLEPDMPWLPIVQGWTVTDYLRHVDYWRNAGVDLTEQPLVGVGSVCRRQGTDEAGAIFEALHAAGVTRLHGFGLKKTGLARYGHLLESADSMAWSFNARRKPPLPGCIGHRNCANCPTFALQWRAEVLAVVERSVRRSSLAGRV